MARRKQHIVSYDATKGVRERERARVRRRSEGSEEEIKIFSL